MSLPSRLKDHNAVLAFLRSADGKDIVQYFVDMRDKCSRQICRYTSTIDEIRYAQGGIDAAEKIANLEKDIIQYLDDLREGKIKKPDTSAKGGTK